MKYIDLHLHLDGSLPAQTLFKLAEIESITLPAQSPEDLTQYITADINCESLNDYLAKFDIPLAVLQSGEALETAAYELMAELKGKNIAYAEIRFAPGSHGRRGLSQRDAAEAVVSGIKRGTADFGVEAQAILCCMRGPVNDALMGSHRETVDVAGNLLGRGVCCVDIAGAEAIFPNEEFEYLFRYANKRDVPFVAHGGEASGSNSIKAAALAGARRIGHGVTLTDDPELVEYIIKNNICIESCITSNVQTRAVKALAAHPLRRMLNAGVPVTLNTDNMTVSGTDMEAEFSRAKETFGLSDAEITRLQENAVQAAFLNDEEKQRLREKLFD